MCQDRDAQKSRAPSGDHHGLVWVECVRWLETEWGAGRSQIHKGLAKNLRYCLVDDKYLSSH